MRQIIIYEGLYAKYSQNDDLKEKLLKTGDRLLAECAVQDKIWATGISMKDGYVKAYREYCWTVQSVDDLKTAPFHILAPEGQVFSDKEHIRHMETTRKYCTGTDPIFIATDHIAVDVNDESSIQCGISWRLSLTDNGGEGMVVKPEFFTTKYKGEVIRPAVKCRGWEYLMS